MAPGPNLCRFERISAERQTWRVGARSPGRNRPGLSCAPGRVRSQAGSVLKWPAAFSSGRVAAPGAMSAASFQPAVEDRVVEIDVAERAAQQLQRVAGEG